MDTLGQKLKQLREERGLTQREAALKLGISNTRLSEYEFGFTRSTKKPAVPRRELLAKMATLYGYPLDVLLALAGYPMTEPIVPPKPSQEEAEERELVEIHRLLSPDQRRLLLKVARAFRSEALPDTPEPS